MLPCNRTPAPCTRQRSAARASPIVRHSLPAGLWPSSVNLFRFPWTAVQEGPLQHAAEEELEQELGWRRGFRDEFELGQCLGRGSVGEVGHPMRTLPHEACALCHFSPLAYARQLPLRMRCSPRYASRCTDRAVSAVPSGLGGLPGCAPDTSLTPLTNGAPLCARRPGIRC